MHATGVPAPSWWRCGSVTKRTRRGATALVVGTALIVQGCASVPAGVDSNDVCSRHRQPMVEAQERFNQTIAVGAVSGAALGALTGALITGDWGGAVAGAVAGGLTGAAAGYMKAKQDQYGNRQAILASINRDVRDSRGYMTRIGASIRRLNTCRANEVADLRRRIQTGQVSKDQARAELRVLRSRIADDRKLVNAVMGDVDEANGAYADALAKTQGVERDLLVSRRVQSYQPDVTQAALVPTRGQIKYATTGVNARAGPGTNYSRVGVFTRGQSVGYLGAARGGWARVDFNGRDAYVASRYLSDQKPPIRTASQVDEPDPPRIDRADPERPRTDNDLEALYVEVADTKAEHRAQSRSIDEGLNSLEALVE